MKIKLFFVAAFMLLAGITSANAQNKGETVIGPRINFYSGWDATGIGVYARYGLSDALRVEPSIIAIMESGASLDISCNLQYAFEIAPAFELYPLAGLSLNDPYKWSLGLNYGGGANYELNNKWTLSGEFKWMEEFKSGYHDPFIFAIGAAYKF